MVCNPSFRNTFLNFMYVRTLIHNITGWGKKKIFPVKVVNCQCLLLNIPDHPLSI